MHRPGTRQNASGVFSAALVASSPGAIVHDRSLSSESRFRALASRLRRMPLDRRQFITFVGAGLASWPSFAHAQTSRRVRTVAVLMGLADDDEAKRRLAAFEQGLA